MRRSYVILLIILWSLSADWQPVAAKTDVPVFTLVTGVWEFEVKIFCK